MLNENTYQSKHDMFHEPIDALASLVLSVFSQELTLYFQIHAKYHVTKINNEIFEALAGDSS